MSDSVALIAPALRGVHAAIVSPMNDVGTVHADDLEQHVASMCHVAGIGGLLVNGHAGEGHLLTNQEKSDILRIVRKSAEGNTFITAGVTSEGTRAACEEASAAATAGADAVLVFPPNHWSRGVDDESVVAHHRAVARAAAHHRAVARAAGLPVVLYKAPIAWATMSYSPGLIARLIEIEAVAGIKEGSWDVAAYEEIWRLVKARRPEVSVMASGDEHLLACFQIGTDGSQVSLAAIAPALVLDLYEAVRTENWAEARALHERVYPLACEIYRRAPAFLATARLKAGLKLLGRIQCDRVRQPMRQLDPTEVADLSRVLKGV